uniref:Uncharacterized protein n=1 Tax=Timema bartmani TaxID=61472 RepID=A0A7R9HWS1_9NEOP|nr:unnamed protein product [Timema bartmani]
MGTSPSPPREGVEEGRSKRTKIVQTPVVTSFPGACCVMCPVSPYVRSIRKHKKSSLTPVADIFKRYGNPPHTITILIDRKVSALRAETSFARLSGVEKLLNSEGRELRRALFSLKQIFQRVEVSDECHACTQTHSHALTRVTCEDKRTPSRSCMNPRHHSWKRRIREYLMAQLGGVDHINQVVKIQCQGDLRTSSIRTAREK